MAQATLNGVLVDDGGAVCQVRFEWGLNAYYGSVTPWQTGFTTGMAFNALLTNLAEATTYHFRAVAFNINGYSYGQDMIFTTGTPPEQMVLTEYDLLRLLEVT